MKMNSKETGKRIQLLRKQKGLSQEELADKLNVSANTIAKIECGLRRPSVDFIVDLVKCFAVCPWMRISWSKSGSTNDCQVHKPIYFWCNSRR